MTERPAPHASQELSPLHEQGGLTSEHWEVISKVSPKKSKMGQFAQAVLDGRVDPSNFSHREYLGGRHWEEIKSKLENNLVGLKGKLFHRFNLERYIRFQQTAEYAEKEKNIVHSLNDYYAGLEKDGFWYERKGNTDSSGSQVHTGVKWWGRSFGWIESESRLEIDTKWGWSEGYVHRSRPADISEVLNAFLLTDSDILDPSHISPKELMVIVRRIPIDVLNKRLDGQFKKRGYGLGKIRNWEKPIPQTS